ncbi:MAG: hypothetical protein KDB54_11510 [Solirubrobacterales bacterium]|nr:hypothetical protein [Solirubrobacterales bacterium]MCB0861266.1 hypothetical protein [Solirubrobacterales bacterium]
MREIKRFMAVAAALITVFALSSAASASQNPPGCAGTTPIASFTDETLGQISDPVREGDEIIFSALFSNRGESACNLSGVAISVILPKPDGTPGEELPLTNNLSLPEGFDARITNHNPWVVDLDEGVFEAPIGLTWRATSHTGDPDAQISGAGPGTKLTITRPEVNLKVSSSPASGPSPLFATTTYKLTNTSPSAAGGLPAPGLVPASQDGSRNVLSDEACGPLKYVSGDLPSDEAPALDPGETWVFTCQRSYLLPGVHSAQPTVTGASDMDGRSWPQPSADLEAGAVKVLGSDLTVEKSHTGDLLAGSSGLYELVVTNSGNQDSSGTVTVADQLPAGLDPVSIAGPGWNCDLASLSCSRSDVLGPGSSFPPVTVTVDVANDPPESVVNKATVSGGGEPPAATINNSFDDPTTIRTPGQPAMPVSNRFSVSRVKTRGNGSVVILVSVPGAGRIWIDDAKAPDLVTPASKKTLAIGDYRLVVRAGNRLMKRLRRTARPRSVRLKVTFRPVGGRKSARTRKARFVLR